MHNLHSPFSIIPETLLFHILFSANRISFTGPAGPIPVTVQDHNQGLFMRTAVWRIQSVDMVGKDEYV